MTMRATPQRRGGAGFTLIELLVVIAVAAVLLMLVAPSMQDLIRVQRLRSVNAQLVTDFQFARSEAVNRRDYMRIVFRADGDQTCYTLFTAPNNGSPCNCLLGAGAACGSDTTRVEVRTVRVPVSQAVRVTTPADQAEAVAFDWRTGAIYAIPTDDIPAPMNEFVADVTLDAARALRTRLSPSGRPSVCMPAGSRMGEATCPVVTP